MRGQKPSSSGNPVEGYAEAPVEKHDIAETECGETECGATRTCTRAGSTSTTATSDACSSTSTVECAHYSPRRCVPFASSGTCEDLRETWM